MITTKVELVQLLGLLVFLVELGLLGWLYFKGRELTATVKWMALITLVIGPILLAFLGNFFVFDHSKTVEACGSCHVMQPMVTDLKDSESMTLAARHYKNHWIAKDQCYGCHKDYGLNGGILSKLTGYRHMMRYVTGAYKEPLAGRTPFHNKNCLSCHQPGTSYDKVEMHKTLTAKFASNEVSCLNCHGKAHPTRLERTPGSPVYDELISVESADESVREYLISAANQNEQTP